MDGFDFLNETLNDMFEAAKQKNSDRVLELNEEFEEIHLHFKTEYVDLLQKYEHCRQTLYHAVITNPDKYDSFMADAKKDLDGLINSK